MYSLGVHPHVTDRLPPDFMGSRVRFILKFVDAFTRFSLKSDKRNRGFGYTPTDVYYLSV